MKIYVVSNQVSKIENNDYIKNKKIICFYYMYIGII